MFRRELQVRGLTGSWKIGSAGLWATPGHGALRAVQTTASRLGLDLTSHRATRVSRSLLSEYDLVVVMEAGQQEALLTEFPHLKDQVYLLSVLGERQSYDIPDTFESESEISEVVKELDSLVRRGWESMCVTATYLHNTKRLPK